MLYVGLYELTNARAQLVYHQELKKGTRRTEQLTCTRLYCDWVRWAGVGGGGGVGAGWIKRNILPIVYTVNKDTEYRMYYIYSC